MKRLVLALLAALPLAGALVLGTTAAPASALNNFTFFAPDSAASDQPIHIASNTPCDDTGEYRYVVTFVTGPIDPTLPIAGTDIDLSKVTDGVYADVNDDGSWEVTMTVPTGTPLGATASYFVGALCITRAADPLNSVPKLSDVYDLHLLRITDWPAGKGAAGQTANSSTTTTAPPTTTTTVAPTTTTVAPTTTTTAGGSTTTTAAGGTSSTTSTTLAGGSVDSLVADAMAALKAQGKVPATAAGADSVRLALPIGLQLPHHNSGGGTGAAWLFGGLIALLLGGSLYMRRRAATT